MKDREVYRNQGQVGLNHVINVESNLNRRIQSGSDLCLVFILFFDILRRHNYKRAVSIIIM